MTLRVALAQLATTVGDVEGNAARIVEAAVAAAGRGAQLVVTPELAITGYPPRDLLLVPELVERAQAALGEVARAVEARAPGLVVVVGGVLPEVAPAGARPGLRNVAAVLQGGRLVTAHAKRLLPRDDVFHERRWFVPGHDLARPVLLEAGGRGRRVGLLVCEDLWDEGYVRHPAADLVREGAELLLVLNASPFRRGVRRERLRHARRAAALGVPVVYVNAVGAEDELVFDGASFALDRTGRLLAQAPACREALEVVDVDAPGALDDAPETEASLDEAVRQALVLGIADVARKAGVSRLLVGVSGGVDSALVLALAADALGPRRVTGLQLPSRFTSPQSLADSQALCRNLGVAYHEVPLEPLHAAVEATLAAHLPGAARPGETTLENAQARLRALLLMAWVNRAGGLWLNSSNKTELALGYGTLYGDLGGGLSPIGDLTKTEVARLARRDARIPAAIVDRVPTAELAPGQVDPFDYPRIAPLVDALVQGAPRDVLLAMAPEAELAELEARIAGAEFKRWQGPPILKVSEVAFGRGRLVPVSHRLRRFKSCPAVTPRRVEVLPTPA